MVDHLLKREHISMLMMSLQPKYARHLVGFPHTNIEALIEALYGIEDGITRDLWSDSSPLYSKGKNPSRSYRSEEVGAISSFRQRPPEPQHVSIH